MGLNIIDIHGEIEGDYDIITTLSNNATNGDIIKALFPTCKDWKCTYAGEEIHLVQLPDSLRINEYLESWWNAPYKRGNTDKELKDDTRPYYANEWT